MNTLENNKLIAEFMGYSINDDYCDPYPNNIEVESLPMLEFMFNSWGELMEVVEKIEMLGFVFKNYGKLSTFLKKSESFNTPIWNDEFSGKTKIDSVYNAVVEFIKYNNDKNS